MTKFCPAKKRNQALALKMETEPQPMARHDIAGKVVHLNGEKSGFNKEKLVEVTCLYRNMQKRYEDETWLTGVVQEEK